MVVSFNGSEGDKEPTYEETSYELDDFIAEAEANYGIWDIDEEDVQLEAIEQKHSNRAELQRIATWAMVGVLGMITIASIATGNEKLMATLAAAAAVFLARLVYSGVTRHGKRRTKERQEPGDDPHDG